MTKNEANGEIGFDTVEQMFVDEPDGASSEVRLRLTRLGTSGQATITWSMEGTGPNKEQVTVNDTGPTSGTVIMGAGMVAELIVYSETCLELPLKNRQNKGLKDRW